MDVEVLVTGATGVLGWRVASALVERGHRVRGMCRTEGQALPPGARPVRGDLAAGRGLEAAVAGVDALVHCATDRRHHREVDVAGTARLLEAARAAGIGHVAYPGIVGADLIPLPYLASKVAVEEAVAASGLAWSIQRYTQLPQWVWAFLERLARWPLLVVPADTRLQVISPATVASHLADAVERRTTGRLPDLGGPFAHETKDLARSFLAATGRRRPVAAFNLPGIAGASLRAGANLTPNRATGSPTWNDFVAERLDGRG